MLILCTLQSANNYSRRSFWYIPTNQQTNQPAMWQLLCTSLRSLFGGCITHCYWDLLPILRPIFWYSDTFFSFLFFFSSQTFSRVLLFPRETSWCKFQIKQLINLSVCNFFFVWDRRPKPIFYHARWQCVGAIMPKVGQCCITNNFFQVIIPSVPHTFVSPRVFTRPQTSRAEVDSWVLKFNSQE